MSKIPERILDKIDPKILLECYAKVTSSEKIHEDFENMPFEREDDRIRIYRIYTEMMLNKCFEEKGYEGLKGWHWIINPRLKTTGGYCYYGYKRIEIAEWLFKNPLTKFHDLRETILHEIAHANTFLKHGRKYTARGHGELWQREAELLNCTAFKCMPDKYYVGNIHNKIIYKCKHESDKCICIMIENKDKILAFAEKLPNLICKKHGVSFEFVVEIHELSEEIDASDSFLEMMRKTKGTYEGENRLYSFGTDKEYTIVEDGDIIKLDEEGNIYKVEPDICVPFD
jgi:predicted SprT family Zn-dependent metalloprotease